MRATSFSCDDVQGGAGLYGTATKAGVTTRPEPDCRDPQPAPDRDSLRRLVEERIIPQLLTAHRRSETRQLGRSRPRRPSARDVAHLAQLAIGADAELPLVFVQGILERGVPREVIYLDLLAPAARVLGDLWSTDTCSFVEVTVGLWRMQQLIQKLGADERNDDIAPDGRRLLLMPEPGEQHTFGLIMLASFFRRDGWYVFEGPLETRVQIEQLVAREEFAVVGLSIGCESRLPALATTIRRVRAASRNASVGIMVGGAPFIGHPERVAEVCADCTAANAPRAVAEANRLFTAQSVCQ